MPYKINSTLLWIMIAVAGLLMAAPAPVQGVTLDKRISQSHDDAQENKGPMKLDSSGLDVGC